MQDVRSLLLSRLLNLFFPSRCPLCSAPSDAYHCNPLCAACWTGMKPYTGPACAICGLPTSSECTGLCESCVRDRPPFSRMLYFGIYEGPLREAIHLLKFKGLKRLSRPLSGLLRGLPLPEADGVVPVPLHIRKLRQREFNQTALVSRHLAKSLRAPLLLGALEKVKETADQTAVSGRERLKNLKGAFRASPEVSGLRILLVDDVITTGATASACAEVLRRAGAKDVAVAALARSMPRR